MATTLVTPQSRADVQPAPFVWPEAPLYVRDIMIDAPVTITPATSVSEAQAVMQQHHIRHLPVLDATRLVGIVSERDIQRVLPSSATSLARWEIHHVLDKLSVADVMTRFVVAVKPEATLREAVGRMLRHRIGALPVVEGRRLLGIITRSDVLRAFLRLLP
jgi:acetoin utilization protein AcuB